MFEVVENSYFEPSQNSNWTGGSSYPKSSGSTWWLWVILGLVVVGWCWWLMNQVKIVNKAKPEGKIKAIEKG